MLYSELKSRANTVANNALLLDWSKNSKNYSHEHYSLMINNLRHWLAPTANRLSDGLKLLQAIDNKDKTLNEIIHAFEHNIEDEKGTCKENSHAFLFNKSATTYSSTVYGRTIHFSKGLPNTMKLKADAENLFKHDIYVMLGASLAQEIHALPQLELLYQGKNNLKDLFCDDAWQDVAYFYEIHLDGTEARHAEDLNKTIWGFIDSNEKQEKFQQGFNALLSQLDLFWKGIEYQIK